MCSGISGPSKPKNIARCENCNKPILYYQERICNLGKKIAYGQDGKQHLCPNKPADKELRCFCERSSQQYPESEPSYIQRLESATPIHAITELKTKTIAILDYVSQLLNYLHRKAEKSCYKGGV
jgi:hypothetical protein